MADTMTPEQRSRCMSRIRSKDTRPELMLRSALWRAGLRFSVKGKLPGRPDICFTRAKLAVFIDGCFWHNCPIHGTRPKSNAGYWNSKIEGNRSRDLLILARLDEIGWKGLRFWEHEVKEDVGSIVAAIKAEWEFRRAPTGLAHTIRALSD